MHIDPKVFAASITGFLLLWAFLAKFLFRPIMGLIKSREQEIIATYANAESAKTEAEKLKSDLEQQIANMDAEIRANMQNAIKEAQDAKDSILADARLKYEDILRKGQEDLEREKEKTIAGLREEVVNLSLNAAEKLIGDSMDDEKHRALINDFIDKIGVSK
jgi:F-type H+-transporting ATPase subunit b